MGSGKLRYAVSDSGPVIHLAEIGGLRFLRVFDKLFVPQAVWLETVEQKRVSEDDLSKEASVERFSLVQSEVAQFIKANNLNELHAGEQECLCLCKGRGIDTLLTDDLAVRDAARRLNLVPVGSLGIIVKAFKQEIMTLQDAEHSIMDL